MDIYPQDLGKALEGEARRRREYFRRAPLPAVMPASNPPLPLLRGAAFLILAGCIIGNVQIADWQFPALLIGALVAFMWKGPLPRTQSKRAVPAHDAALTMQETEWLRAEQTDILQGAFLELAQTALASPAPPDGLSHTHLRDALRALGDAVRDVPELSFKLTPRDAKEMQTVAERLTHDAAQETDSVVADSLRRRSDALHSQAETVTRTQSLLRRNAALRLELFDQMAALRTGLAASAIGHTGGARDLSALAASIASVAAEAAAVTGARAEVDSYLHAETDVERQKMIR